MEQGEKSAGPGSERMFGRGVTHEFTIDLRRTGVLVDTRNWEAVFGVYGDAARSWPISLTLLPRRMEFAYRVLLAATSSHELIRGTAHDSEGEMLYAK